MIIKNKNGLEYDVLARVENFSNGGNAYLLAEIPEEPTDGETWSYFCGGAPVQYVVARYWDEKSGTWGRGEYFWRLDRKEAEAYFREVAAEILF